MNLKFISGLFVGVFVAFFGLYLADKWTNYVDQKHVTAFIQEFNSSKSKIAYLEKYIAESNAPIFSLSKSKAKEGINWGECDSLRRNHRGLLNMWGDILKMPYDSWMNSMYDQFLAEIEKLNEAANSINCEL